jgi:hypothetical protein
MGPVPRARCWPLLPERGHSRVAEALSNIGTDEAAN